MIEQKYNLSIAEEMSYDEDIICFWKPYGNDKIGPHVFCQWYKTNFIDENNIKFSCTEQYMMFKKAMLFGDKQIAYKILLETDPSKMKKYGRLIKNFDDKIWNENKFTIVYNGNYLKFTQNDELKKYIKSTGNSILVEASPYDNIWGVKLSADNDDILYPEKWKGENLLGFALMQVRDNIK